MVNNLKDLTNNLFENCIVWINISKMSKDQIEFTRPWSHSDVCFRVEDRTLHANKTILSLWSPVFRAMFENDFKEKTSEEVALPFKKFKDIDLLLKSLHPPIQDITNETVETLLPLYQEYQIEPMISRCEALLCNQANSVKNFILAQKYELPKLNECSLQYLKRAPLTRLKAQAEFDQLEQSFLLELLTEKVERFESNVENLREVRMVLERKRPTSFPGAQLLCDTCTTGRDQQVDCQACMKSCCQRLAVILRNMEA